MSVVAVDAGEVRSGKGHTDENFPVASVLIHPRHREAVLAFYRFARTADDVADHASLSVEDKLALLHRMGEAVQGRDEGDRSGRDLCAVLRQRGFTARHPLDLLAAFRTDVTKLRYADWDDLMDYCRYSAMPVGRFVLDVHGESEKTWPASDALCAALQVINHLQDCAKDFRALDRVYLPQDVLLREGASVDELAADRATPGLRRTIVSLAHRTGALLETSRPFAGMIRDRRLAAEVAVIQAVAERLVGVLLRRDPLSEPVHFGKRTAAWIAVRAAARHLVRRGMGTA